MWIRTVRQLFGVAAVAGLIAAGCGDDSDPETTADTDDAADETDVGDEPRELTAAIPFPSGAVFYPLYVAEAQGYFADEGLTVQVEVLDGSGPIMQALLSDQIEIGLPSPSPFLQGVEEGADLVSVYTLFQSNVFSLVTEEDSEIADLADLEDETIGVGTIDGGETPLVRAMLAQEVGLEEGQDYEFLEVGDGGPAAVALEGGEVAAYAAAFPDVAIIRLRGLELRDLISEEFQSFFDSLIVMERDFMEDNPEVLEGFGRALARATEWGFENPDQVIDITSQEFPEEAEDRELTRAFLDETIRLFELPPEADGRFGYAIPSAVDAYVGFLVEQGELAGPPSDDVFVNDYVDVYNTEPGS